MNTERFPKHMQLPEQSEEEIFNELIARRGPWKALELFQEPELTGLERMKIFDATRKSIWNIVDEAAVNKGLAREVDDHLLVLEFMDQALAEEIQRDLATAALEEYKLPVLPHQMTQE